MSKIRRETPAKPPRKGAGGGDVRVKKEKISKGYISIEKAKVEQKEGCPNKEGIKKCKGNERSGMYRVIKPFPLAEGGENTPSSSGCGGGGENDQKGQQRPP